MKRTIFAAALCAGLVLTMPVVQAVGVAVNPGEVTMEAITGTPTTVRIKVSNPSTDVAVFEVYPDDFPGMIRAIPSSFTLESSGQQQVVLEVTAPEDGTFSTLLSVVGRPLASNAFQAGSGVKVPLTITAVPGPSGLASALATIGTSPWTGFVALVVLAGGVWYRRKRTSPSPIV